MNGLRVVLIIASAALLCGTATRQRFSIAAMQQIVGVSPPAISWDGRRIAFAATRTNLAENKYDDALYVYDTGARSMKRLAASHTSIGALRWSPDGASLAAVMHDPKNGGHDQLYLVDPQTGTEQALTSGSTDVMEFTWSPDGRKLVFSRRDAIAEKTGLAKYRDGFEVTDNAYLVTKPAVPAHLWITDRFGNERRLTSGQWSVVDAPLSWSPDGRTVVFLRAPNGIYGIQDRAVAMRYDLSSGQISPATAHPKYEDQALYSPDGTRLAYLYARDGNPMNEAEAMAAFASGGQDRDATRILDRHVETAAWMPNSRELLVKVYDAAAGPLFIQPIGGSARRLPLGPVVDASIDSQQSVARDGTIAFAGAEERRPSELYLLRPGAAAPLRLTSFNDAIAALDLGRAQRIAWQGPRGMREDGVLTYPPSFDPGKKWPLVLRIHGGPTESSLTDLNAFNQLAAARGYLVFSPNYRGSNDLGNAYEHAIFNDASIGPGRDIMAGIAAVERMGFVDKKRIGVSGWSYGGQMTSWMEARYGIFKAAVAGAAVNDIVVDYAIADDIDADAISFAGGSPYKGHTMHTWRLHSPITYFKDIRTPTLIMGNVYDVRVPIVESYEMYHALRDNGVPVRFFTYPTAGHLPSGPVRLADVYEKWLAWFDHYLQP